MRRRSLVLAATCLASALAAAASETFEARLAKLERLQREDMDGLREELRSLQQRLHALEKGSAATGEQPANSAATGEQPTPSSQRAVVTPVPGRALSSSSPTCCRWTHDDACSSTGNANEYQCTSLHEFLEDKTTTHEFEDLESCLGTDQAQWSYAYNPTTSASVALTQGGSVVAEVPTPLKVTHAAGCTAPPTLELQLNTSVPALRIDGQDVAAQLAALAAHQFATPWANIDYESTNWVQGTDGSSQPMYSIMGGIVYMKGGVQSASGSDMNGGDRILRLPEGARPSERVNFAVWAVGSSAATSIEILTDGWIMPSDGGAPGFYLDGAYFFL